MQFDSRSFHNRHEALTEMLYDTPGMLPARYVFVLTTRCNLRCPFCFQAKKDGAGQAMTGDDWLALAAQLPEYARVTFTGGEPLIFPDFKRVFDFVASRHDCNLITNGLLLTEELVDFLLSFQRFRVLSVSVDSVGNTLRGVSPGKWAHAERMMRYFVERRRKVHPQCLLDVKTTVVDDNSTDLLAIHRYCVETLGCDHHGFQFLKGSPLQHADEACGFEEIDIPREAPRYVNFAAIKEQLAAVQRYNLEKGGKTFLHPKAASLNDDGPLYIDWLNESLHRRQCFAPCKYPWASVHVNADGHLFPCLAVSMGNVRRQPLAEIVAGERFRRFRELIRARGTVAACNRCGWLTRRRETAGEGEG